MQKGLTVALIVAGGILFAACGDDEESSPSTFEVAIAEESENSFTIDAPAEVEAGAVQVTLDNSGNEAPHAASIVKVEGDHTVEEALEIIESDQPEEIPEWIRGYGGVGDTAPGETAEATVLLDEGHYFVQDDADNQAEDPVIAEFDVTGESDAELPETDATVTAAETGTGDEKYSWETEGLVAGENELTFVSEGEEALHHIVAAPINEGSTIEDVRADLEADRPPRAIDFENTVSTSVLDGEKSQVLTLDLEPGRYAFVCFLPDRGTPEKPHFQQGLLSEVEIPSS